MSFYVLSNCFDILLIAAQQYLSAWFTAKYIRTKRTGLFCLMYVLPFAAAYSAMQLFLPGLKDIVTIGMMIYAPILAVIYRGRPVIRCILYPVIQFICMIVIDYLIMLLFAALLPEYSADILAVSVTREEAFSSLSFALVFLFRMTGVVEVLAASLIAYYTLRGNSGNTDTLSRRFNRFLPIFLLELLFAGLLLAYNSVAAKTGINVIWITIGILIILYLLDILVWHIFGAVENAEKALREKQELELIASAGNAAYTQIMESNTRFRTLRHDMLNQLQTASILLDKGETREAARLLKQYQDDVSASSKVVTGSPILDAVVSLKAAVCEQSGIALKVTGNLPGELPLSNAELCSAAGNLLDNAIHAVQALDDPSKGEISFSAYIRDGKLVLCCKNTAGIIDSRAFARVSPDNAHGWGLYILSKTAEKHGGAFTLEAADGVATALFWVGYGSKGAIS